MHYYISIDDFYQAISNFDAYQMIADCNCYDNIIIEWYDAILESVENVKPADVRENIHGSWRGEGMGDFSCTICGWEGSGVDIYCYCPNCGAIMY